LCSTYDVRLSVIAVTVLHCAFIYIFIRINCNIKNKKFEKDKGKRDCTVNAFKARLDKFWQHQLLKFDFTADLTGTGNRSEEVIK